MPLKTRETLLGRLRPTGLAVLVYAVLGILFIYPLSRLVISALSRDGAFGFGNFAVVVLEPSNLKALLNSLYIGVVVTLCATTIGFLLSWVVIRTNVRLKRLFQFMLVMPFFIPPFIMAFAWRMLLGRAGYINIFLQQLLGLAAPPIEIYGAFGVILVSTIYTYPYAFIVISRAVENMDAHLEEAAQMSGASKRRVITDIVLPVLVPAVGAAAVIVFVTTISMFGIPALLGTPGRFIVITTRIYGYVGGFRDPNGLAIAAALSLVLVLVALAGLFLQNHLTRKERYAVVTGKAAAINTTDLRAWRTPITAAVAVFVTIVVIAPIAAIGTTSVIKALGVAFTPENISLKHYLRVLTEMPIVRRSMRNSFALALSVPTIGVIAAIFMTFLKRQGRMPGRNALDYIVSTPYAIPGIVIGVAMIRAWIKPVLGISIYNTIWILFIAYIVRFMIFPMRTIGSAWKQLDNSLEEAGRISGAGQLRTLRDISVPLIRAGVLSGWLLAFMPALTELTLSILLYSPGNETVGVTAFNMMQEGLITVSAAYAMMIIAVVVVLNIVLRTTPSRKRFKTGSQRAKEYRWRS